MIIGLFFLAVALKFLTLELGLNIYQDIVLYISILAIPLTILITGVVLEKYALNSKSNWAGIALLIAMMLILNSSVAIDYFSNAIKVVQAEDTKQLFVYLLSNISLIVIIGGTIAASYMVGISLIDITVTSITSRSNMFTERSGNWQLVMLILIISISINFVSEYLKIRFMY